MSGHLAIIGAGDLGTTIGKLLAQNHEVKYWDVSPRQGVASEVNIKTALEGASVAFLCVPTLANQKLIKEYKKYLNKKTIIVTFSKGLNSVGLTVPEILQKNLKSANQIVHVGGPMLFAEIGEGKMWWPIVCSKDKKAREKIIKMFSDTTFKQSNMAVAGAIAGVSKNCYALAAGIATAAGWGSNTMGKLFSQSIIEIEYIIGLFSKNKDKQALVDLALADLMATSLSPWSKNRTAGQAIFNGQTNVSSEGIVSIKPFVKRLGAGKMKKLPLLDAVNKIVNQKAEVDIIIDAIK